jgi:hypothetical protein
MAVFDDEDLLFDDGIGPALFLVSGIYIAQLENDSIYDQYARISIGCL